MEAAGLHCLLESKDWSKPISIEPIAILRNQLLRRPATTIGMVFSRSGYTEAALLLAGYLGGQTILLWHPGEVTIGVNERKDRAAFGGQVPRLRRVGNPRRQHGTHGGAMRTHVLVESNQSAIMLTKLLSAEQEAGLIEIRAARPSSSLYSAARTLLAVRGEPVALLLDADSTYPEAVARRQLTAEEVVDDVASSAPVRRAGGSARA